MPAEGSLRLSLCSPFFRCVLCVKSFAVAFDYRFGNSNLTPTRPTIGNPNCKTGVAAV